MQSREQSNPASAQATSSSADSGTTLPSLWGTIAAGPTRQAPPSLQGTMDRPVLRPGDDADDILRTWSLL